MLTIEIQNGGIWRPMASGFHGRPYLAETAESLQDVIDILVRLGNSPDDFRIVSVET